MAIGKACQKQIRHIHIIIEEGGNKNCFQVKNDKWTKKKTDAYAEECIYALYHHSVLPVCPNRLSPNNTYKRIRTKGAKPILGAPYSLSLLKKTEFSKKKHKTEQITFLRETTAFTRIYCVSLSSFLQNLHLIFGIIVELDVLWITFLFLK